MRKAAVLGNGSLAVGLNEDGLVSDFYYPYVGQNNLTDSRRRPHYIGIWVDGQFSWLHSSVWKKQVNSSAEALEANCVYQNPELEIQIKTRDFVDPKYDIFRRELSVENNSGQDKKIRVFFYQNFFLSQYGRTDTAMYVPDEHYIYDYKGHICLLIAAEVQDGKAFDQWAVGNTGIEGKEGTFRDAEDGELSGSLVEHSSVDSAIRCSFKTEANSKTVLRYWVAAGDSQYDVERLHAVARTAWKHRDRAHRQHWDDWLQISKVHLQGLSEKYQKIVQSSLLTIKAHCDQHGGVVASLDSSIFNYGRDYYSYVWPRDGAYVMQSLLMLGHHKETLAFLEFCSRVLKSGGYLQHKYQSDGALASTWHPLDHHGGKRLAIQEDETAIVLQLAIEYYQQTENAEFMDRHYQDFLKPMAEFMISYRHPLNHLPYPSYDLWEQKLEVNTYTVALVIKALKDFLPIIEFMEGPNSTLAKKLVLAVQEMTNGLDLLVTPEGYYAKGLKTDGQLDTVVDISTLYGLAVADVGDNQAFHRTLEVVEERLFAENGGVIRYEQDGYFAINGRPNPWFVASLWLAQVYQLSAIGTTHRKSEFMLAYVVDYLLASTTAMLPEQITPDQSKQKIGVTPLIWSHAELIKTILTQNQ